MVEIKKAPVTDPHITLAAILDDLLFIILSCNDRKPADSKVWEAIARVDTTRRQLQRELGQEPTAMRDPHGRAHYEA